VDTVSSWQARMSDETRVDKRYWALVRGHVRDVVEIDHPIRDDARDAEPATATASEPLGGVDAESERESGRADGQPRSRPTPPPRSSRPVGPAGPSRPARSRVTPLLVSNVDRCSLVEVRLFTGRRHQARRHLKHISHPVIGDATHGKGAINRAYRDAYGLARMALHARSLVVDGASAIAQLPSDLVVPLRRLFGRELDEMNERQRN
jgi:tRNA pseudouridine65 synthase